MTAAHEESIVLWHVLCSCSGCTSWSHGEQTLWPGTIWHQKPAKVPDSSVAAHPIPNRHEGCDGQVKIAALPPLISLKTAESILFIGKAVQVLQASRSHLPGSPLLTQTDLATFASALRDLQAATQLNRTHLEHTIEDIRTAVRTRLCWLSFLLHYANS